MSHESPMDWLRIENLAALDALVGRYITGETPEVHWEDSYAGMRFDSVEEGLEALREPYFQQFIPVAERPETVLHEVRVFMPYATSIECALEVVQKMATPKQTLRLWRDRASWCAAFGDAVPSIGQTAPIAICLAALRVKGLEVLIADESTDYGTHRD